MAYGFGSLNAPRFKVLVASTAYTTTTTTAAFTMPLAQSYQIMFYQSAVTGTSPTMDAVVQSSPDGGTTYINLPLRTTQITAAGQNVIVFRLGQGDNEVALESPAASTGGTLAKNCIFDPNYMKIKFTLTGTNPSITTTVYGGFIPVCA